MTHLTQTPVSNDEHSELQLAAPATKRPALNIDGLRKALVSRCLVTRYFRTAEVEGAAAVKIIFEALGSQKFADELLCEISKGRDGIYFPWEEIKERMGYMPPNKRSNFLSLFDLSMVSNRLDMHSLWKLDDFENSFFEAVETFDAQVLPDGMRWNNGLRLIDYNELPSEDVR